METAAYIHVPFCRRKCPYCDFYSIAGAEDRVESYLQAVRMHSVLLTAEDDFLARTAYIGGGTPSVLAPDQLRELVRTVSRFFRIRRNCREFTVELNPESVTDEKLRVLKEEGVDRVSIGAQSFVAEKLSFLGRIHTVEDTRRCLDLVVRNGFRNVSIDLMYGCAGETAAAWERELTRAAQLPGITHISAYTLSIEPHTPFSLREKDALTVDESAQADLYGQTIDILAAHGFRHYEVSNFARTGYECAHNQTYWENDPYIGIGPAAVNYQKGKRSRVVPSVAEYCAALSQKKVIPYDSSEQLGEAKRAQETACLQIRRAEGILFGPFTRKTGVDLLTFKKEAVVRLVDAGLLTCLYDDLGSWAGIALTRKGFLLCDSVCGELLE